MSYFRKHLGQLDGLALCAGRVPWKKEDELTADDWNNATFELTSQPYNMAFHFSRICNSKSRIVALSSISAKYGGSPSSRHYGAAKAALESSLLGLSRSLYAKEICQQAEPAMNQVAPGRFARCHFTAELDLRGDVT